MEEMMIMTKRNMKPDSEKSIARLISYMQNFLDHRFEFIAITPLLLLVIVLTVLPTIQLLQMSFSEIKFIGSETEWTFVGFNHFTTLMKDPVFLIALQNTVLFTLIVVPVEMGMALLLAIFVSRTDRFVGFYRTIILFPLLIPPVAISVMWILMYNYEFGFINQAIRLFGHEGIVFLENVHLAMPSVMIVDAWNWTSFLFLIILAGIESLPVDLPEAARIDGASEAQVYRYIILPLLRPTLLSAAILRTIFAIKVFDEVYTLTGGGPGTATTLISPYIFDVFFGEFRWGYGAFLSLIPVALSLFFVAIYQRANRQTF